MIIIQEKVFSFLGRLLGVFAGWGAGRGPVPCEWDFEAARTSSQE
ncbi:hypothetical protein AB0J71_46400 [Nonomuraea sp. NPDC049637]